METSLIEQAYPQVLISRYYDSKKLVAYLSTIYAPGTFELKVRRGKYLLYAPFRLSKEQQRAMRVATGEGSSVSLAETQLQLPNETFSETEPAAASTPEQGKSSTKVRRCFVIHYGKCVWTWVQKHFLQKPGIGATNERALASVNTS